MEQSGGAQKCPSSDPRIRAHYYRHFGTPPEHGGLESQSSPSQPCVPQGKAHHNIKYIFIVPLFAASAGSGQPSAQVYVGETVGRRLTLGGLRRAAARFPSPVYSRSRTTSAENPLRRSVAVAPEGHCRLMGVHLRSTTRRLRATATMIPSCHLAYSVWWQRLSLASRRHIPACTPAGSEYPRR